MSYKSILVHADQTPHSAERIRMAAAIAVQEQAHLIGTAMTGISHVVFETGAFDPHDPAFDHHMRALRSYADKSLEHFEQLADTLPELSMESRLLDDDVVGGMTLQARYADLVVLGQFDAESVVPGVMPNFPESVVMNCARPVMVVPTGWKFSALPSRALVAWDGSMTATRAVTAALPLLRHAAQVDVAIINPGDTPDAHGEQPGADIALYLSRHGIAVNVSVQETRRGPGEALLSMCSDAGADLLVMGAYGHTRFREMVLGGATRDILSSMTVPVLMAH